MRFRLFYAYFLSIVLILLLLAACGPTAPSITPNNGNTTQLTPTAQTSTPESSTADPAIDTCPSILYRVPNCYTPHSLRVAYGIDSLFQQGFSGKGQTVVVIDSFGSPTLQQDMNVFDQQFGLPPITIQIISPLHEPIYDPRNDRPGWVGETSLDVEMIHAIAPGAGIVVLTSPVAETEGTIGLPEFLQLEQYAVNHHLGNIISQSWGASEVTLQNSAGQQEIKQWDAFYHQATTQQGITFFTGSGDNGATDYADLAGKTLSPTPTTSFPSDDPWVTSVGGTTLLQTGTSITETAWDSSGGGFSSFFATPSYQQSLPFSVQTLLANRRGVPDVAGDANPATALAIYSSGTWDQIGGTSASAPFWAALTAIANQMAGHPLGFINPALYKLATSNKYAQDFQDITVGNNSVEGNGVNVLGYNAAPGWDPITGWGSPIANKLLPDLISTVQSGS
jgi:subtilase family serine protease